MTKGEAAMTIVGGEVIMAHGIVYGHGGTIYTTPRGEAKVKDYGYKYGIVKPEEMLIYTKRR